jgi:hypothetical protein
MIKALYIMDFRERKEGSFGRQGMDPYKRQAGRDDRQARIP